jgi:ParB-like nuclease domain
MAKSRTRTTEESPGASNDRPGLSGELQRIRLDRLRYDPKNPRVAERLDGNATQAQIEQLLLGSEMKARELVPSFIENGYIPYEPLIVRPEGQNYVVVEGNRRLAALRSMVKSEDPIEEQAVQDHQLSTPPCLVFSGDEKQLLAYLGLRHLSKTKDWSTSAKGAFVERILRAGIDLQEAGRLTNTTTNALRLILLTRRLLEQANELGLELTGTGGDGETVFWQLGDAVRRARTKAYLRLMENPDPLLAPEYDQSRFENLIGWLYGNPKTGQLRVINSIRDIATLDSCLGHERATKALESGASLAEAQEELQAAGANIAGHIERARRSLERASGGSWAEIDAAGLQDIDPALARLRFAIEQLPLLIDRRREGLTPHAHQP